MLPKRDALCGRARRLVGWRRRQGRRQSGRRDRATRPVQEDLLRSVPGSGPTTATTLLTEVPALGHLDRKASAVLLGVAPLNCESGTLRGRRLIWARRRHAQEGRPDHPYAQVTPYP